MGKNKEINAIPVTPFFYDPLEVESKTDVKSMPKLNADVNVKEMPKVVTDGTTTVKSLPKVETDGSVDVKSLPLINAVFKNANVPLAVTIANASEFGGGGDSAIKTYEVEGYEYRSSNTMPINDLMLNLQKFLTSNKQIPFVLCLYNGGKESFYYLNNRPLSTGGNNDYWEFTNVESAVTSNTIIVHAKPESATVCRTNMLTISDGVLEIQKSDIDSDCNLRLYYVNY